MKKVLIGIQCRMNSHRLPGKALMQIGDKSLIEHVVGKCLDASKFLNNQSRYQAVTRVALLVPFGDKILIEKMRNKVDIIQGPELDVLARYAIALQKTSSDYIVRITGDCLYIPSHTISRHVKYALQRNSDYCNNILQRVNPEGWDTEVISKKLLGWLEDNALDATYREHVTNFIPHALKNDIFPARFKIHTSTDTIDMSDKSTSIDTLEQYQAACAEFERRREKLEYCKRYGEVF